jgi:hypothetical protein
VKEEKKSFEKLNFELIATQALVATMKEAINAFEIKLHEGLSFAVLRNNPKLGESDRDKLKKREMEYQFKVKELSSELAQLNTNYGALSKAHENSNLN